MDLVGVLWVLPAAGGTAKRLTSDLFDIAQPEWSPDGKLLTFQPYRDGTFNLWVTRPDGSGMRQLTQGPTTTVSRASLPAGATSCSRLTGPAAMGSTPTTSRDRHDRGYRGHRCRGVRACVVTGR
jgi:WD40-like Beta Propeller Repeat